MITPLRQAAIFSDFEARVHVAPLGTCDPRDMHWSAGACFMEWSEASAEELLIRLFQVYAILVEQACIPAIVVHRAFRVIPEYRATLPDDHPDALTLEEWRRYRYMMDIPARCRTDCFSVA